MKFIEKKTIIIKELKIIIEINFLLKSKVITKEIKKSNMIGKPRVLIIKKVKKKKNKCLNKLNKNIY